MVATAGGFTDPPVHPQLKLIGQEAPRNQSRRVESSQVVVRTVNHLRLPQFAPHRKSQTRHPCVQTARLTSLQDDDQLGAIIRSCTSNCPDSHKTTFDLPLLSAVRHFHAISSSPGPHAILLGPSTLPTHHDCWRSTRGPVASSPNIT
jgi:hypothetical protein